MLSDATYKELSQRLNETDEIQFADDDKIIRVYLSTTNGYMVDIFNATEYNDEDPDLEPYDGGECLGTSLDAVQFYLG